MTETMIETTTDNTLLFNFFQKNIRHILSNLEYNTVVESEIPVLIGTIELFLNSSEIEWQNEGRRILEQYPILKKYFNTFY